MTKATGKMHGLIVQWRDDNAKCLAFVCAAGHKGVRVSDVRVYLGRGLSCAGRHLRDLEARGQVEKTGDTGSSVRWGLPGIREASKSWPMTENKQQYLRRIQMREADLCTQRAARVPDEELPPDPIRIIVPASQAVPIRTTAVRSVWELAAA